MADWKKLGKDISQGFGEVSKKASEAAQKKYEDYETKRVENLKKEAELQLKRKEEEARQREIDAEKQKILDAQREEEEKEQRKKAIERKKLFDTIEVYTVDLNKNYTYLGFVQGYGQQTAARSKAESYLSNLSNPVSAHEAREDALRSLKKEAVALGANAIIGFTTEVVKTSWKHSTSGHKSYTSSLYECFSSGTAIKLGNK